MGDTKLISPALLRRHLHKVDYPASRDELLAHARSECERVMATLAELPDRAYNGPMEVSKAFAELARKHLDGVSYPASREDLVEHAKRQGASKPVIEALKRIPTAPTTGLRRSAKRSPKKKSRTFGPCSRRIRSAERSSPVCPRASLP